MATQNKDETYCQPPQGSQSCCRVESMVSVDERGQMVLPKETRTKMNINSGDKLALVSWQKEGQVCCLCLVKADDLTGMVRDMLGPLFNEVSR